MGGRVLCGKPKELQHTSAPASLKLYKNTISVLRDCVHAGASHVGYAVKSQYILPT